MAAHKSREMMISIANRKDPNSITGCRFCNKTSPAKANQQMLNDMLVKTLHAEKQTKLITPLMNPSPKSWLDIKNANNLLYERCLYLKNVCESVLETKNFKLYMFGSQLSGHSRSGRPDIDIWCLYEKGTLEQKYQILRKCSFKLDFMFINKISVNNYFELFTE